MKRIINFARFVAKVASPLLIATIAPLAVLSSPAVSAVPKAQAAQPAQTATPISVQFTNALPDAVMPGLPIALRWTASDTMHWDTIMHDFQDNEGWLKTITLTDAAGNEVPVTNLSVLSATRYPFGHGRRVGVGNDQVDYVILQPQWPANTTSGEYMLKIRVHLPYTSTNPLDTTQSSKGVVEQEVTVPVHVNPYSSVAAQEYAQTLSKALYGSDYKGPFTSETAIKTLFAMPKEDAGEVRRKALLSETPPERIASDYLLDALAQAPSSETISLCKEMCRLSKLNTKSKDGDWRGTIGWIALSRMYPYADATQRLYIAKSLTQITGRPQNTQMLEQGKIN